MLCLKNVETSEIVAVLRDVDLGSRLEELRAKIEVELPGISEYEFSLCGTGIRRKQEPKYQVRKCATKSASDSSHSVELHFLHSKGLAEDKIKQTLKTNGSFPENDEKGNEKANLKNPYPKYFSQEEIDDSSPEGFEKERKIFFNKKLAEIVEDSSLKEWNMQEIRGVITVHWVLRKTEILKNAAKELIVKSPKSVENPCQAEKNFMKNFDNLEKAQFMVDSHYKRLSEELNTSGEENRPFLEKEFDKTFSELKIAQANMVKSITEYENKVKDRVNDHLLGVSDIKDESKDRVKDHLLGVSDIQDESIELLDSEMDEMVFSLRDDLDF